MLRIAVLVTCHNRRDATLACIRSLEASATAVDGLDYTVFLTDDGSTDGTARAVEELAVPTVIAHGAGDLFWNRGMIQSWKAALEQPDVFDGFLLLNDDTILDERALSVLLEVHQAVGASAVIVGATRDPVTAELTYGGIVRTSSWHPGRTARLAISPTPQDADTFNANCVYVPRVVFEAVGILDSAFHHSIGDYDYGYRVKQSGMRVVVAPGTLGTCARNDPAGSWRDVTLPLRHRLKLLEAPKGLPRSQWRAFLSRHGAPLPGLLAWAPTLQVLRSWLHR